MCPKLQIVSICIMCICIVFVLYSYGIVIVYYICITGMTCTQRTSPLLLRLIAHLLSSSAGAALTLNLQSTNNTLAKSGSCLILTIAHFLMQRSLSSLPPHQTYFPQIKLSGAQDAPSAQSKMTEETPEVRSDKRKPREEREEREEIYICINGQNLKKWLLPYRPLVAHYSVKSSFRS